MAWNNDVTPVRPAPAARFLGGPPLTVLLRLADVLRGVLRVGQRLWDMGFEAFGQAGRFILAGAVIVVPIWFVMRLLTIRGPR